MAAVAESKQKSIATLILTQTVKCLSLPQIITTLAIQQWSNIKESRRNSKIHG